MEPFVHLHVHTQYSLLDGATRVEQIFQRAFDLGMPAVAITDHGNMYGAIEFFKAAVTFTDPAADPYEFLANGREFKVRPIIGCELYMCDDLTIKESVNGKAPKLNHLILLAKDEIGYKNLIKLVSVAYTEGFYHKPRIDFSRLEGHTEGLICLSACLAGVIPQALLNGDDEKAQALTEKFVELFHDDFYIEIQDHNIRAQKQILPKLVALARKNNIKLIATNDVHYLRKKDAVVQKMLQCISFQTTMQYEEPTEDDARENSDLSGEGISDEGYFPTKEFYLKSGDEMSELFKFAPDSITNTLEVAAKCRCDFFRKEPLMPSFIPDDGSDSYAYLRKLTDDGLAKKYKVITDEIRDRAEYELGIISSLHFVDYFLIVWDFIHWSENNGIPVGPGRGSGVGSIVAYAIGITKVDPLKYALIFERFLNPERVSNPDFDIDFCVDRREDVIDYVTRKYGEQNVSQIVTFGTLKAKAAVKDVGRVYNHPYSETQKITKPIPTLMGKLHIEHLLGLKKDKEGNDLSNPELKEMYNDDLMSRRILDMAMAVEGMPRQTGMHAAGVIICRDAISDHVPMAKTKEGIVTTQYNMVECEELGLLKMDFLGLRTLTDIKKAIDIIKQTRGVDIDFYDMEYNDQGVFDLISSGDTHAVFQLESEGMKKFMRDLKPTSLEDIIAGISLYRPGPMQYIDDYVLNKRNPARVKYDTPLLEPILSVTYGIMVYQEQVMKMVQELAGYSMGRADNVRRMMSKKKHDAMEKERAVFLHGTVDKNGTVVEGCIKRGVPENIGNKVFDDMTQFASYAFNKSHAAAYAYLSYQTAYLKKYYTVEFVTAVLNNRITSIDEIRNYLTYLKERAIKVLPPNINKSRVDFCVEDGSVRIGMAAIKNVGAPVITAIVAEREKGGDFHDFVEFVERMSSITLNKKMLESLIYSGTFDCFEKTRCQLINVYEQVLDRAAKDRKMKQSGQISLFETLAPAVMGSDFKYPNLKEFPLAEKLQREKDVSGIYLTGHPLEEYTEHLKNYPHNTSMFKVQSDEDESAGDFGVSDGSVVTVGGMLVEAIKKFTKSNKEMGIGKLEDLYGTVELAVSPYKLASVKSIWQKDKLVTVTGKLRAQDVGASIWVDSISEWEGVSAKTVVKRKICFYISLSENEAGLVDKLQDILMVYPGIDETFIKNTDDGKLYPLEINAEVCTALMTETAGLLGADNIKVI